MELLLLLYEDLINQEDSGIYYIIDGAAKL